MQEHTDSVAETFSYPQLMGGSYWRTSVTCSAEDSRVCNSVKTKHKISTVLKAKVTCLSGWWKRRDSPGDGKHLTWWSIFPAASARYHLGLFLLPLLALTFSQPYIFFLIPSAPAVYYRKSLCLNKGFAAPRVKSCCLVPAGLLPPHAVPEPQLCISSQRPQDFERHSHHTFCPSEVL